MRCDILIKIVVAILIISGAVSPALAYDVSQFQWGDGTTGRLIRGEELSYNGYTVKVIAFPAPVKSNSLGTPVEPVKPFVGINISKNGKYLGSLMLMQGEYYIVPDGELKVTARTLPAEGGTEWVYETYSPWAEIDVNQRGTPLPEVLVETDYDEYISTASTEITASVSISNTGSADLINVNLEITTPLNLKRGVLKYYYERIKKGETKTNSLVFTAPIITELNDYEISANATGYDAKDIFYTAQSSKTIRIAPEPEQIPTIRKNINAKIYLEEYAMVSISFKNNANFELRNVSITDTIPNGFSLLGNNSLQWKFTVPAMGEWDTRYLIKPTEANKDGAVLSAAIAEFRTNKEYYTIQSNQPKIVVHGPKISLSKTTDVSSIKPGDTVTVTVSAENVGSTPTKVSITDELPPEGSLVSGITSLDDFLEAGKIARFSYSLIINSDQPVKLPYASAEYYMLDAKSGNLMAISNEPEIGIKSPESESAGNSTDPNASFEINQIEPTPEPVPELPFTPIIYEEEIAPETPIPEVIPAELPAPVVTPVMASPEVIQTVLKVMLSCGSADNNESIIACSLINRQ